MKKKTLICTHVMPSELEMFERLIAKFRVSLQFLDSDDDVTFKATLNLNPELTDWESSTYKQDYFITKFALIFNGIKNINEIILDTSCWGTTQQKRDSIKLDYDQFIFCDTDIVFHPHFLKHQLNTSYKMDGIYIVSPSLAKWWDTTWDIICHSDYLNKPTGYAHSKEAIDGAWNQEIKQIEIKRIPSLKFGCGMHTLYSKSFWELVGIPESFGGYGPEDTYGMAAGELAIRVGYDVKQYLMDGIYITEDTINRTPSFDGKIVPIDKKREFYKKAEDSGRQALIDFTQKLIKNQSNP
jgi:hypothetical protein